MADRQIADAQPDTSHELSEAEVSKVVRLSTAQAMVGAVYAASTGGMFLIGYALMLGANNIQIGLMSTIPMFFIGVTLLAASLIEHGVSRRRLTMWAAAGNVLSWLAVILIPYVLSGRSSTVRMNALIAIITVATAFAYISGNARSSWLGDLVPARIRGGFFGRMTMFGGMVGAVFAALEGHLLDNLSDAGIAAFSGLFAFGVVVGLVNCGLFMPQPDMTVERHHGMGVRKHIKATIRNRPLMAVMMFALLWSMQMIAGPFYSTYMIRDLKMSFLGIGLVNAVLTMTMLLSGPFWGKIVDKYGCRSILTVCSFGLGLLQLVWLGIGTSAAAYSILPWVNIVAGLAIGGVSVALSTLIYKVTPRAGRAVQFAVYSIVVTLAAAPLPLLGGHLPEWVAAIMPGADLRVTFYACIPSLLGAALVARCIDEPGSHPTRVLLRALPGHVRELWQRIVPGSVSESR